MQISFDSNFDYNILLKDNSHITFKQNYAKGRKIAVAYSMFNEIFDGHTAEFTIENASGINVNDIGFVQPILFS